MKGKLVFGTFMAVVLVAIVSSACVTPAFASSLLPGYDHTKPEGSVVINIAGHQPPILLDVYHFAKPTSHGVRDCIDINLWYADGGFWIPVATMLDNPAVFEWQQFFDSMGPAAGNTMLVKPWELEVCGIGKTVFAYWTKPLTATITEPWKSWLGGISSVTLPPGRVLLQGYGSGIPVDTVINMPLMILTMKGTMFNAHATFVCPAWHYCGPIGDPSYPTNIFTDVWFTQSAYPP